MAGGFTPYLPFMYTITGEVFALDSLIPQHFDFPGQVFTAFAHPAAKEKKFMLCIECGIPVKLVIIQELNAPALRKVREHHAGSAAEYSDIIKYFRMIIA